MNKKAETKIGWLIAFLVVFLIMNFVSIKINGSKLEAVNQWISIIGISLVEALIIWGLSQLRNQ